MLITRNNRTVTASSPKFVYSDSLRIILVNPLATSVFKKMKVSVFRCQNLTPQLPDTRNLTPETYKLRS